eukprot:2391466-Prymnesium_polylepis.1
MITQSRPSWGSAHTTEVNRHSGRRVGGGRGPGSLAKSAQSRHLPDESGVEASRFHGASAGPPHTTHPPTTPHSSPRQRPASACGQSLEAVVRPRPWARPPRPPSAWRWPTSAA